MRTARIAQLAAGVLCLCALPYAGYRAAIHYLPAPEPLACPDIQAIPETRVVTLLEAWPIPPEATPIPAPRRSVQRKRQTLIPPSMPAVEQCAPPAGFYGPEPQVQHVPEPSSLPLALAGLAGVFALRRKEGKL